MKNNHGKKLKIISCISGKGGVGKTSICLSLSQVLGYFNKRVLTIDLDVLTHGMTYFFIDDLKNVQRELLQLLKNPQYVPEIINTDYYDVIPSTNKLGDTPIEININDYNYNLKLMLEKFQNKYDYIILDCQAGKSPLVKAAIHNSDIVLIVSEADPISIWTTKSIEYEYGKHLPQDSFGVINKLFLEEKERYNDFLEFSRMFKYLPPLPFDIEVRRYFARRSNPANLDNPSDFIIKLCYLIKDLFPELIVDVEKYLENIKLSKIGDIQNEKQIVEKKIQGTTKQLIKLSREKNKFDVLMNRQLTILIAMLCVSAITFASLSSIVETISFELIIVFYFLISLIFFQLYIINKNKKKRLISEVNMRETILLKQLNQYIQRKDRLEIMIIDGRKGFL